MYICENYYMMTLFRFTKLVVFTFLIVASFSKVAQAQDYKSALGGRLGTYISVSFSTYVTEGRSIELIGGFTREANQSDFLVGGFYKIHGNVTAQVPTLKWYFGGGFYLNLKNDSGDNTSFAPGGIIGMEYTLDHTPVNFFIDASPNYNLNSDTDSNFDLHANLGVRYVLKY